MPLLYKTLINATAGALPHRSPWALGLLAFLLLALPCTTLAQAPPWATTLAPAGLSADGNSGIAATAFDRSTGLVYVAGTFLNQISLGGTVLTSAGGSDAFLGCYSPATGTWNWVKREGGAAEDRASGIAVDGIGGVYVTGKFDGSATFAGQALTGYASDMFVAAYAAADGTGRWAQSGGGQSIDEGNAIATDGVGGVYVTGNFTLYGTFGGQFLQTSGWTDVFVTAYSATTGTMRWVKSGGGGGADLGQGIAADALGGVYVTGFFQNSGTFAGQLLSGTVEDVFVAAYTAADGSSLWARSGGGSGDDRGQDIATDGQGTVYVTGFFEGSGTFAGLPTLVGADKDVFVAAYAAADGVGRWAISNGGNSVDNGLGISADTMGNVYVTGCFYQTGIFAGQALSEAGSGVFVAAYAATDGTGRWATSASSDNTIYGNAIATDGARSVYVGISTTLPATFGSYTLSGSNNASGVLAELLLPPVLSQVTGSSGSSGQVGSFLTLQGVGLRGATRVSFNGASTTAITNNTDTSLTVEVPVGATSGPLAITTPLGTSNGLSFTLLAGLATTASRPLATRATLHPNPAHGQFALTLPPVAGATHARATLLNALGQVLDTRTLALPASGARADYSTTGLAVGVYALRLQAGTETATLRVVVE
jgi:hypothetical protein